MKKTNATPIFRTISPWVSSPSIATISASTKHPSSPFPFLPSNASKIWNSHPQSQPSHPPSEQIQYNEYPMTLQSSHLHTGRAKYDAVTGSWLMGSNRDLQKEWVGTLEKMHDLDRSAPTQLPSHKPSMKSEEEYDIESLEKRSWPYWTGLDRMCEWIEMSPSSHFHFSYRTSVAWLGVIGVYIHNHGNHSNMIDSKLPQPQSSFCLSWELVAISCQLHYPLF